MKSSVSSLFRNFDLSADRVKRLSRDFCGILGVTTFGYVRVYNNGTISWVTTNPEQDRFLIESQALNLHPLVETKNALKEGCYIDFNNYQFPGSELFYQERAKRFQIDHSMVVVRHQKDFLETCCFSGLSTKRSLLQIFMNEQPLFRTFMEYFTTQFDRRLTDVLSSGIPLSDLKDSYGAGDEASMCLSGDRTKLIESCGWKNLLCLSKREKQCLGLLKEGYTYQTIGTTLGLSERTVEHYLDSVKNKLGAESRSELFLAADKLVHLKILSSAF